MSKESSWLEYDWRLDGEEALFGVELSFYRKAPDEGHPYLCYFCYQTHDEEKLTPADVKRIADIASKHSKRIGVSPAGFVQTGSIRQYYYYVTSKSEYDQFKAAAGKEKRFLCRVGGKREDDWATYFQLLYPNEVKYQTVKNREQIEKLRKTGDNNEASRRINLHVAFRTEDQRLQFEAAARQAGFAIGTAEFHSDFELPHGSVIHRISTLKKDDIDPLTVRTVRLAQKMDGRLLYWDCNIVPKNVTKRI